MSHCQNCGHDCHCGGQCKQSNIDEFGNKNEFVCCGNCRHEEQPKIKNPEDVFNGA